MVDLYRFVGEFFARGIKLIDEPSVPVQIVRAMPISKDTLKAIVIIVAALALLCLLLLFANHIRPHP